MEIKVTSTTFFAIYFCICYFLKDVAHCNGDTEVDFESSNKKVAIIGGGVGGSFTAKYLVEYNVDCSEKLDSVTLFEPSEAFSSSVSPGVTFPGRGLNEGVEFQGGRSMSLKLKDGTLVELGASIIYSGNALVKEMVESDPELTTYSPGQTCSDVHKDEKLDQTKHDMPTGFGVWDTPYGFSILTSTMSNIWTKFYLFYHYNIDLLRMSNAVSKVIKSFDQIYKNLESNHDNSFFSSPDEVWHSVGLLGPSRISFDEFLDSIGISKDISSWFKLLNSNVGNLRKHLLASANLSNYNQNNSKMNGLAGLVSFVPTAGKFFAVCEGNGKIPISAFSQAKKVLENRCNKSKRKVEHIAKRVTTVIANTDGTLELRSGDESQGEYDIVILAAPLQQCRISFFLQSHVDTAILLPMPLNGMVDSDGIHADEHPLFPRSLPSSATRAYTQTITTVISNGRLQHKYFNITESQIPQSIYFTEEGKRRQKIHSISQLTADGIFKMFSSEKLSRDILEAFFGSDCKVEFIKEWGGEFGGAYPDFNGGGENSVSTQFLLYDGGVKKQARQSSGAALYYVSAMEASVSALEISAIGAKAVSKLVAQRIGILHETKVKLRDEL